MIAIEIMSPKNKKKNAAKKAIEYLDFGIEYVWVIDPRDRAAYRGTRSGLEPNPSGELTVTGTQILVRIGELFDKFDKLDQFWKNLFWRLGSGFGHFHERRVEGSRLADIGEPFAG